jgi:hypothetical protein
MGKYNLSKVAIDLDALGIRSADLEAMTSMQRTVAEAMRSVERSDLHCKGQSSRSRGSKMPCGTC